MFLALNDLRFVAASQIPPTDLKPTGAGDWPVHSISSRSRRSRSHYDHLFPHSALQSPARSPLSLICRPLRSILWREVPLLREQLGRNDVELILGYFKLTPRPPPPRPLQERTTERAEGREQFREPSNGFKERSVAHKTLFFLHNRLPLDPPPFKPLKFPSFHSEPFPESSGLHHPSVEYPCPFSIFGTRSLFPFPGGRYPSRGFSDPHPTMDSHCLPPRRLVWNSQTSAELL